MTALLPQWLSRAKHSLTIRLCAQFTAVLLLGTGVIIFFVTVRTSQLIDQTIFNYGNTISAQLAQVSLDAAVRRDAIALQAHLARLMKTPGMVSASVYDVQNELLAQAGSTPTELHGREHLHHFPTALAVGDNIAGRVVVTIDTTDIEHLREEMYAVLGGSCAVMLILICLTSHHNASRLQQEQKQLLKSLLHIRPSAIIPTELTHKIQASCLQLQPPEIEELVNAINAHIEQQAHPSPAALMDAATAATNQIHGCAYLLLECSNYDLLERQISRERLRSLLAHFQDKIENTSRLYSGQRSSVAGAYIKILFIAAENQEVSAAKQAACCAHVLATILKDCNDEELGVRLNWRMALDWHKPSNNDLLRNIQLAEDEQRGKWLCQQVGCEQLAFSEAITSILSRESSFVLNECSGSGGQRFYRLAHASTDLSTLLDRQAEQLGALWTA